VLRRIPHPLRLLTLWIFVSAVFPFASGQVAHAQSRSVDPRAINWQRLHTNITVEFTDNRLEDVMTFIRDYAGVDLEPMWQTERQSGLDKDAEITLSVKDVSVLALVERVLERTSDEFDQSTWQFSRTGALEMGPKSRLNRKAYLKVYDINDLIFEIPDFPEIPTLDLDTILSQSQQGGGGGGGSIFEEEDVSDREGLTREERIQRLEDLIVTSVEPEQWQRAAGDGATIQTYENNFLIRAPAYIHRKLIAPRFMRSTPTPPQPPDRRGSDGGQRTRRTPNTR